MLRVLMICCAVAGCVPRAGGPASDACDGGELPELQIGQQLTREGPAPASGPIAYGDPPQGGAPYAPYELRMRASLDPSERVRVLGVVIERESGEELGSAEQSQAFFCANTGVHEGWRFGGELHLRFWGRELGDLEGREVDLDIEVILPDGQVVTAGTRGVLAQHP